MRVVVSIDKLSRLTIFKKFEMDIDHKAISLKKQSEVALKS